jgi:hypothetical protein
LHQNENVSPVSEMNFFICLFFLFFKVIYLLFLYSVLSVGTLWHLQRFLQCINYVILEFTLSTVIPAPQFMEQLQQVSLLYLHASVHIFCTIFILPPHFPATSHSCQPSPLGRNNYSALLVSDFAEDRWKEKYDIFVCLR